MVPSIAQTTPVDRDICDANSQAIDQKTPPSPVSEQNPDDWALYSNHLQFETAEFLFQNTEMSASNVDQLCNLWVHSLHVDEPEGCPLFIDHKNLYGTIDAMLLGDVPWESFKLKYNGERPMVIPPWMDQNYEFWFHPARSLIANMLSNMDFDDFSKDGKKWHYENFMSGDWAWSQADKIAEDPATHGGTFIPIILGSNKVATGQNDYWPVYLSIRNIYNNVQHAHCKGVELLAFLAIPKVQRTLATLKHGMTMPPVMKCPDRHFCCIIFGIGPYITNYLEQVQGCFTFPNDLDGGGALQTLEITQALIEEFSLGILWDKWGIDANMVTSSINLSTFKDHLVEWVGKYLELEYGKAGTKEWLADIDKWFPDGRGFSQWTGDDSKVLIKFYLPAIEGHVLKDVVCTIHVFLEICYIIQRNVIMDNTLMELKGALNYIGIRVESFSLPCQHSLIHYKSLIRLFGAPNVLCTSITESKHIMAVKKPWWHSNKHNALGQMFQTNQCLSQLAAARANFEAQGMLPVSHQAPNSNSTDGGSAEDLDVDKDPFDGVVGECPGLVHSDDTFPPRLIAKFVSEQLHADSNIPHHCLPPFTSHIKIFNSATTAFASPSDPLICAVPLWHQGPAQYDCIYVSTDNTEDGMLGMVITRIFPCVLVHWFNQIADEPDELTGMWMVSPSFLQDDSQNFAVIHIDSIVCAAHLLSIFGDKQVPSYVKFHNSLNVY
ncbi:hypothetical protein BS17DRAFT_798537 [Gyrodon lividus]|nr:hypothetical protein BS17DRAFT_798537 [Gyrodon lividus]